MSGQVSFGRLAGSAGVGGGGSGAFNILVIGDFSGRAGRGVREPLAGRRRLNLDVDNWERVLGSLAAEVRIPAAGGEIVFTPAEIDDFHPDFLYAKLDVFKALRGLRERLTNSATFEAAAAEIRSWAGGAEPEAPADASNKVEPPSAGQAQGEADKDTLGRLFGDRPAGADAPVASGAGKDKAASAVDSLIRGIVGPHIVPDRDMERSVLLGRLDYAIAEQMRAVLHDRGFQAVETAWRGVQLLVTHLETDEDLRLAVMDASRDELASDLLAGDDLAATALHGMLVAETHGTPGARTWSLLCGAFAFEKTADDAELLGRLARIAAAARAPLVASAGDSLVAAESIAADPEPRNWTREADERSTAAWDALRKLPEARWVSLGLPRVLLRQPYGEASDPADSFEFEEIVPAGPHEQYLWGPASFAMATALGQTFREEGWDMGADTFQDIGDLPTYVYKDADGDRQVLPCAEVLLTDRAAGAILSAGLTAIQSVKGLNVVRIRGVAGLVAPPAALAGPWKG